MNKNDKKILQKIKKEIKAAKNIAIFCHRSPDMDCLGSMFALGEALERIGKKVTRFSADKLSIDHKALFDEKAVMTEKQNADNFDLFISVDVATGKMLDKFEDYFTNFPLTIKIDHHNAGEKDSYALLNYVDSQKSSCSEIIFELIEALKIKITPTIATYLYAGLSADTNSFINTNTNLNSFQTGCKLLKLSADIHKVNEAEYRLVTRTSIAMKKVLYNNLQIFKEGFAICLISKEDLTKNKADKSDCSTFSSEMLAIEGVNISCNITEHENKKYSLSFRSRKGFNVNGIAKTFGGGGHIEASGARIENCTEEQVVKMVAKAIRENLKNLKSQERV